jgi:hypothetical protein
VFERQGPFCYIRAFKDYVNFGFWRGMEISRGAGVLQSGGKKMAHVKMTDQREIKDDLFKRWVKEAVRLNLTNGDPTRRPSKP